jgi:hypothetical protein
MNFLPIARLEMRAAARKPMTYYSRSLAALLAILTGLAFVLAGFTRLMSAASAGQAVFVLLAGCAYVLMAAQGMLLTCDCVSLEKREGTLGLLFLTGLNGFDIVAGKLAAQVGRSLYCLIAAFPAFGCCLWLGGVGPGDFVKAALGLSDTLFYFAALGILISVCVWRERVAAAWGGLALLLLGVLLPILGVMFKWPAFLALLPAGAMLAALGPGAGMLAPPPVAASLLAPHIMGWLFIGAASCFAPRTWVPAANATPAPRPAAARQTRLPSRDLPPWVVESSKPVLTTALLFMICAVLLGCALLGPRWMLYTTVPAAILLMHGVLKFLAASQAGRMLAARRRSGELELLLTTPCDEDEILRGCLLELKRSLFWPALFAIGVDLALVILGIFGWGKAGIGFSPWWAGAVLVEVVWLVVNLYSLAWVGLFLGLKLGNPTKAAGRAILYVVLLPWLLLILFAVVASPLVLKLRFDPALTIPMSAVFLVSLVFCNTFFAGWAVNELRDRFRAVAAGTSMRT